MTTALYIVIGYMILDLIITVAKIGKFIKITPALAAVTLVTHGYIIFVILVAIGKLK